MQNPWMSVWLSEYNRYASAAKGQIMAEASRQQTAMQKELVKQQAEMMEAWTEQVTAFWLQALFPWLGHGKKRR